MRLTYRDGYRNHPTLENVKDGFIEVTEIMEENNYYLFGLKHKGYNELPDYSVTNKYKYAYGGKELNDELGLELYDFGARNYDAAIGRWLNVDPLAEKTMEPYLYAGNNPIRYIDPTGMSKDDIIDINIKTGGIKVTQTEGDDVVRLVDNKGNVTKDNNGKEQSYTYGKKGSFLKENTIERNGIYENIGYKVHFQDTTKADQFFKFAAKSDVEFASMNFFFGDSSNGQSTVLTNGSSRSVNGTEYAYKVLRSNSDAFLLNFSHSHPGKLDQNLSPAYPSGFDENLQPTNRSGDRHRYLEGRKEFGNRIPDYFNLYIPDNPAIKVKHNGQKVIRTINL